MNEQAMQPQQDTFNKLYPITQRVLENGGIVYTIFLNFSIEDISEFSEILSILDTAEELDTVVFKINNYGGSFHTTVSLLDAIKVTKAQTIAECSGMIASAATVIALACDSLYIADFSTFMLHNYSGGVYGKGHEIEAEITHSIPSSKEFVKEVYANFLNKKEIKQLIKGADFYFTTEEVRERWKKVVEHREKEAESEREIFRQGQINEMIKQLEDEGYTITKE